MALQSGTPPLLRRLTAFSEDPHSGITVTGTATALE